MTVPRLLGAFAPGAAPAAANPLLVLLPSLGTTTALWDGVVARLRADERTVAQVLRYRGAVFTMAHGRPNADLLVPERIHCIVVGDDISQAAELAAIGAGDVICKMYDAAVVEAYARA